MNISTYDRLLDIAEQQFAENGFYGTSINNIAVQLSLTKQGLLHYFPTKSKLYGAVLENASKLLMTQLLDSMTAPVDHYQKLLILFNENHWQDERLVRVTRLVVRELIDNQGRAEQSQQWYMKDFLNYLNKIIKDGQRCGEFKKGIDSMAFIYSLLGAHQYFLISLPTLEQIHSKAAFKRHLKSHSQTLRQIIEGTLLA